MLRRVPLYDSRHNPPCGEIVSRILEARPRYQIEGITFSGGEPTHQIDAIAGLLIRLDSGVWGPSALPTLAFTIGPGATMAEQMHANKTKYTGLDAIRTR
jgi:organic radical activating enzyme